ncbi:hypothetical protein ACP70R_010235 [Stipagrostis hirtigluma subsp. patula]
MAAMKPNPSVVDPPEVSRLSMLLRTPAWQLGGVQGGEIASIDKGLVVIYAGTYRPGHGGYSLGGCYLVYDASNDSVSAIPPLPDKVRIDRPIINGLGCSAAILRRGHGGEGDYVIAEIVTIQNRGLPDAELYLWWSSPTLNPYSQWIPLAVRLPLPPELCRPACFHIDMAFVSADSCICWVDLLTGILVCDLVSPQVASCRFIPLPEGYSMYTDRDSRGPLIPPQFRSMGCVCGVIKFVSLIGSYDADLPSEEVMLKTWTLSSDLEWKECQELSVGDIWASESFKEMELPRLRPVFPVLSMDEDEIIIFLNDMEHENRVNDFGIVVGRNLILKAQYMVCLDLGQNKVLISKKSSTNNLALLMPSLLATEFSAYLGPQKTTTRYY